MWQIRDVEATQTIHLPIQTTCSFLMLQEELIIRSCKYMLNLPLQRSKLNLSILAEMSFNPFMTLFTFVHLRFMYPTHGLGSQQCWCHWCICTLATNGLFTLLFHPRVLNLDFYFAMLPWSPSPNSSRSKEKVAKTKSAKNFFFLNSLYTFKAELHKVT